MLAFLCILLPFPALYIMTVNIFSFYLQISILTKPSSRPLSSPLLLLIRQLISEALKKLMEGYAGSRNRLGQICSLHGYGTNSEVRMLSPGPSQMPLLCLTQCFMAAYTGLTFLIKVQVFETQTGKHWELGTLFLANADSEK